MKYIEGLVDVLVPRIQEAILGIVPTCPLTGEPAVGDEQICLGMRETKDERWQTIQRIGSYWHCFKVVDFMYSALVFPTRRRKE